MEQKPHKPTVIGTFRIWTPPFSDLPKQFRASLSFLLFSFTAAHAALAEGWVYFGSQTAPTHLESHDGPLAETNIVSQLLVGYSASNLLPTGEPQINHHGIFVVTPISVFQGRPGDLVYVQLAAWDKTQWGLSYSTVPKEAKGVTDTIAYYLDSNPANPPLLTFFNSSAVVPSYVPEPSKRTLLLLGAIAGFLGKRRSRSQNA